jgi:SNF2 family DNA or RNA helicase
MPGMAKKKATASFLQLAIRLRQAVSHPFTLFNVMRDTYDLNDIKDIRAKMREIKNANPDRRFIEQVGSWCETQLANGSIEGEVLQRDIPEQFGKGDHGYEFDMDPQLAKIEKSKSGKSGVCPICSEPHTAPRKTKCGHIFCRDCIENVIETERTEGSDTLNCPVCNKVHKLKEIMARQRTKRGALNVDMPGSDYSGLQPLGNEASAEFLEECDKNVHLAMAPSAKTVMVKDVILKWQEKVPDDKIIVFTQWVVVGRVIGRMLQQEKIGFVYYFGEMTQEEKEANVKAFHAVDEVKVMVGQTSNYLVVVHPTRPQLTLECRSHPSNAVAKA